MNLDSYENRLLDRRLISRVLCAEAGPIRMTESLLRYLSIHGTSRPREMFEINSNDFDFDCQEESVTFLLAGG